MSRIQQRILLFFLLPSLLQHHHSSHAQPLDYPTANLSTLWTNSPSLPHNITYPDGSNIKALLLRGSSSFYGPSFACGFFCRGSDSAPCASGYLFAIFIVYTNSGARITLPIDGIPQVVWSANRDRLVKENSTLELTKGGDLVLKDADGSLVWSSNTLGKSVARMSIMENGNLVLLDDKNATVWQSFDYPTDALLSGQRLARGQRLTVNASASNWTPGQLYLSSTSDGSFGAFVDSSPPQLYYRFQGEFVDIKSRKDPCFLRVMGNSTLVFVANSSSSDNPNGTTANPPASALQFLRLESDGHLRLYEWGAVNQNGWNPTADVLDMYLGDCAYPTVCGNYGICLKEGQCTCPQTSFRQVDNSQPKLGCSATSPLSCDFQQYHQFMALRDISYFNYIDGAWLFPNRTTEESCKEMCLRNCSCKAALFQYGLDVTAGSCYMPTEIFSLMTNVQQTSHYNSTAFIKVQVVPPPSSPTSGKKSASVGVVAGSTVGALFGAILIISIIAALMRKRRHEREEDEEADDFNQLPGMPTRFSFEELRTATDNFAKKLGEGGFGSVFEGTLTDGIKVAIKRLESVNQGKREFLAEVETIGSIHHLYLVRLVGFCVEKSHRLLVYEFMSNGSLDKWIFHRIENHEINWETRCKIINHVAKGLLYLHEECRQKIVHLDIKPQNILLDENFDAKVSDFGLSRLIDRDQSAVITTMRGTPGYLAPEWLTSKITEKADVYSFGVVVVEIVCGRKNLDYSQPEECVHLLSVMKDKALDGQLFDIIDKHCPDILKNEKEALDMMKLAMWCLHSDIAIRPSMSAVVKVLEGAVDVIPDLEFNFTTTTDRLEHKAVEVSSSAPLLASVLSGPR